MNSYLSNFLIALLISVFCYTTIIGQDYKILESDENHLIIEFNFSSKFGVSDILIDGIKFTSIKDISYPLQKPGDPFLPTRFYQIGIPQNTHALVTVLETEREVLNDKFVIATPDSMDQPFNQLKYNQDVYGNNSLFPFEQAAINSETIFRYLKIASLSVNPFQFNPVQRTLILNKKIVVRVDFKQDNSFTDVLIPITDKMTEEVIKTNLINPNESLTFLGKIHSTSMSPQEKYWYDPNKDYYKMYLNSNGVYRVTCDFLTNAGIPANALQNMQMELISNGESIPIDVVDVNNDNLFNSGDYFQFVGEPAKPADQFTRMNIYNKTNVYWFSYQADSVNYYKYIDGLPRSYSPLITNTIKTLQWEEDITYQHLGHANNDQRDYWQWGYTEAQNGLPYRNFLYWMQDSIWNDFVVEKPQAKIRVGLHGLTSLICGTGNGHNVNIKFNTKTIGTKSWNGQQSAFFENSFYLAYNTSGGGDTAQLVYQGAQKFEVECNGNICNPDQNDLVLVNYFELEYWAWNKTNPNYFYFSSPPNNYADNRYYLWRWERDNMKIYIPSRNELISNPDIKHDIDESVYFIDTISTKTNYYCVAEDYYLLPDSIIQDSPSYLRNITNGADYIIITHPLFLSVAQRLAEYRSSNLKEYSTPRIKVIDIGDIYDEFSYGLMNPIALQYFTKYAFDNWQNPAPTYIVLMGDLSTDYRKIYTSSRTNYIPSLPYHSIVYGQAASDNAIVTVAGDDLVPELAIGRISCESLEEANLLIDKIIGYPADNGKEWKKNVLLLSSGLSAEDENNFKFNDRNMLLANNFLDLEGINSTKVFRYPNKPEYIQYQGEGPDIRREIDNGAVLVNYYGHGGGYQWDLVFTNDDILALSNGNRLPFIISVTCYTAHFDNQEVFGEIFNSIPGKGSIAFFGSSGVTFWPTTASYNQDLFREIFRNKKYVIGDAILKSKSFSGYGTMIALLTLLGDPALELALPYTADFVVNSSSISINPINPIIDDTVQVKIKIKNLGTAFFGDSVKVELFENGISDSTLIGSVKLNSFGDADSTYFIWIPKQDGVNVLTAVVNGDQLVDESDYSDNNASQNFSVFSIEKPKILKPVRNYFTTDNTISFVLVDVGNYVQQNFTYNIIIDTARNIGSQFKITSPVLTPQRGIVIWTSPQLSDGEYFYEVYIVSESDTNKSDLETFSISSNSGNGYLSKAKQLLNFDLVNLIYSEQDSSLFLNTSPLPPKPSKEKLLDSITVVVPDDSTEITTCTTDGSYIYFGHLSFYKNGNKSKIYKVGTGLNGTTKGLNYGSIGNIEIDIKNQIFYYSDGFIYAATGDDSTLLRISIENGDTTRIDIPGKLLPTDDGLLKNGGFYLCSDGQLVYNISAGYGEFRNKYVLRILDPSQGWKKINDDILFSGSSANGFSGFFVNNGYIQTYESYNNGYVRRYRLSDGYFEEQYLVFLGNKQVYSWTFDWTNNFLYGGLFVPNNFQYLFGFYKFVGTYQELLAPFLQMKLVLPVNGII